MLSSYNVLGYLIILKGSKIDHCFGDLLLVCSAIFEVPCTSRNKFHDWLEKTIEETTETKDNNPETIEVRVFKNE